MLKTAEILAGDFGEEELSQRRYQQIQEFFPDTGASHTARRRLDTH
jgi:hypothetical protein